MPIFKALHILSMFAMVTVFLGAEFFYAYAVWQRDVRALAWVQRAVRRGFLAVIGRRCPDRPVARARGVPRRKQPRPHRPLRLHS